MKKILTLLLVMAAAVAMLTVKGTKAQEDLQVSPSVWVLGTNAIEEITIHIADHPYNTNEIVSVAVDETPVQDLGTFSDNRGDLVIKFYPGTDLTIGVHTVYVSAGDYTGSSPITVKETVPSEDVITILGGDKVRGTIGEGTMALNCENWDGSNGEPCPYGDYDPSEVVETNASEDL